MTDQPTDSPDARLDFPATRRNRDAILGVLARNLPREGMVLEIGSGSGQHISYFAHRMPHLAWQPSDPDPRYRASIAAWIEALDLGEAVHPPLDLASTDTPWPVIGVAAVFCVNMIHIAPWGACLGLMENAARVLPENGLLFLYGPFMIGGRHTAPSNEAFDAGLREQNPEWGVRDLDDVALEARRNELQLVETVQMPANNLSAIFRKRAGLV